MMAGLQAGNFLFQPGDDCFADEAAEGVAAGVIVFAFFLAAMAEEGEGHWREGAALDEGLEDGNGFHFAPIEFAIEEEAEALRLAGGAAKQAEGSGVAGGGIEDGVGFEFDHVCMYRLKPCVNERLLY